MTSGITMLLGFGNGCVRRKVSRADVNTRKHCCFSDYNVCKKLKVTCGRLSYMKFGGGLIYLAPRIKCTFFLNEGIAVRPSMCCSLDFDSVSRFDGLNFGVKFKICF